MNQTKVWHMSFLKNHTAMPFQDFFQLWAVAFRAGGTGTVCRVGRYPVYFRCWGLASSP